MILVGIAATTFGANDVAYTAMQMPNTINTNESTNLLASSINIPSSNMNDQSPRASVQENGTTNINSIDSSAEDLLQLKRKLELEKAQNELKKLHNIPSNSNGMNSASVQPENIQTTVTGVAINQDGKKIAWLQFADGGSLTVNVGSKVGTYTVKDITMNGVELMYFKNNKAKSIFLKRVYNSPEKRKNQQNNNVNQFFNPSPIVTSANAVGNEIVPPIVPVR